MNINEEPYFVRLTIVGDRSVGKSCILKSYTTDVQSMEFVQNILGNLTLPTIVDNHMVQITLWELTGSPCSNSFKTVAYYRAHIFLLVFSVVESISFDNILSKVPNQYMKWYPELSEERLIRIPKIIVGNKIDIRNEENSQHIKYGTAKSLLESLNCKYFECSSLNNIGIKQIFDEAIRIAIQNELKLQSEKDQLLPHEQEQCYCNLF